MEEAISRRLRVVVVGSGTHFLSGLSYYTWQVANSLSCECDVSVVLMKALVPKFLYPGRRRVGEPLAAFAYDPGVQVFDGVNWWWVPSIVKAVRFLRRQRPEVVLMQWWTGAVAHSYLILALAARLMGSKVLLEFHEAQDVSEARLPLARRYARFFMRRILRLCSGIVVHSKFDSELVDNYYDLEDMPRVLIPHGPYDQYRSGGIGTRECTIDDFNVVFFGVIRPFKGLEHLVRAFGELTPQQVASIWMTVIGETWEGWTLPNELIDAHPYRDRITFVNRYVTDEELAAWLGGADLVVLPYLRSSSSGPLHAAMSMGLPVVITSVGGLPEAAGSYEGVTFVEPGDVDAIKEAILHNVRLGIGRRYEDPHSWGDSRERYTGFFETVGRNL